MLERTRNTTRLSAGAGSGGDFFDSPDTPDTVTVSNGPYGENYPVAGMTVGQVRARLRDRLDIDPLSQAIVDGRDVGEDTIVQHGQALMFAHRASEKGAITIDKETVTATSPEGVKMTMKQSDFLQCLVSARIDTSDIVLPMGTRSFRSRGRYSVLIHETRPRVCNFKWIHEESPVPFGKGAMYRTARIALPYVLVFAVLEEGRRKTFRLSDVNECFFSNEPLSSLDQKLCYPALLNCSRFDPPEGRPLSWICTQYLRRRQRPKAGNRNRMLHAELNALLKTLYEDGFNYSSEHHEVESWFTASRKADKRLASIAAWEEATTNDPLCALDIAWLPTKLSASEISERIFHNLGAADQPIRSSDDLARIVFNSQDDTCSDLVAVADGSAVAGIHAVLQKLMQHHSK